MLTHVFTWLRKDFAALQGKRGMIRRSFCANDTTSEFFGIYFWGNARRQRYRCRIQALRSVGSYIWSQVAPGLGASIPYASQGSGCHGGRWCELFHMHCSSVEVSHCTQNLHSSNAPTRTHPQPSVYEARQLGLDISIPELSRCSGKTHRVWLASEETPSKKASILLCLSRLVS